MYDCLPMYHSVGGVVATGAVLVNGGSVVIRERFSAQHFWDDVADGTARSFQYIGELCRYLVNAAASPPSERTGIRLCCGNGLRRRRLGGIPGAFQDSAASSSSMPRPKAMSRSSTSRARPAPSAAFRRSSPTASRWRW